MLDICYLSSYNPPLIYVNDLPMNKKNIRSPNSLIEALSVLPNICRPFECLDNLNILKTRTNLITRSIARDMAWFWLCWFGMTGGFGAISSSFSATIVARVMKYGIIATRSIMFIMSLLNSILLGQARNLTRSSNVNQMMHNVSTIKNGSVTSGTWNELFCNNINSDKWNNVDDKVEGCILKWGESRGGWVLLGCWVGLHCTALHRFGSVYLIQCGPRKETLSKSNSIITSSSSTLVPLAVVLKTL